MLSVAQLRGGSGHTGIFKGILQNNDLSTHHIAPRNEINIIYQRLFGRSLTKTEIDDIPGLILPNRYHQGVSGSTSGFHQKLNTIFQDRVSASETADSLDQLPSDEILRSLRVAYQAMHIEHGIECGIDYRHVATVMDDAIRALGIDPITGLLL